MSHSMANKSVWITGDSKVVPFFIAYGVAWYSPVHKRTKVVVDLPKNSLCDRDTTEYKMYNLFTSPQSFIDTMRANWHKMCRY